MTEDLRKRFYEVLEVCDEGKNTHFLTDLLNDVFYTILPITESKRRRSNLIEILHPNSIFDGDLNILKTSETVLLQNYYGYQKEKYCKKSDELTGKIFVDIPSFDRMVEIQYQIFLNDSVEIPFEEQIEGFRDELNKITIYTKDGPNRHAALSAKLYGLKSDTTRFESTKRSILFEVMRLILWKDILDKNAFHNGLLSDWNDEIQDYGLLSIDKQNQILRHFYEEFSNHNIDQVQRYTIQEYFFKSKSFSEFEDFALSMEKFVDAHKDRDTNYLLTYLYGVVMDLLLRILRLIIEKVPSGKKNYIVDFPFNYTYSFGQ